MSNDIRQCCIIAKAILSVQLSITLVIHALMVQDIKIHFTLHGTIALLHGGTLWPLMDFFLLQTIYTNLMPFSLGNVLLVHMHYCQNSASRTAV